MVSKNAGIIAVDPGFPDVRAQIQDPAFMGRLCATMTPSTDFTPVVQPGPKI
jgi:hypothetical protein